MKDYQVSEKKMTQTWGVLDRQAAMKLAGTEIPREAMKAETGGGRILAVREEETRISREKYLEVTGVIYTVDSNAPNIEWKILLPFCWNKRSVQVGGGANNGQIPTLEKELLMSEYNPAEHGFVVFGDDSGHQSRDPMSADFASNEEALQNYIRLHLIKTNGVTFEITNTATPDFIKNIIEKFSTNINRNEHNLQTWRFMFNKVFTKRKIRKIMKERK